MDSITKQMLGSLVRALLIFLGGLLVSRNLMSQDTADGLANSLVAHIVGIILIVAPLVVKYFSTKQDAKIYNATIKEAVKSKPGTTVSTVKTRTLKKIRGAK